MPELNKCLEHLRLDKHVKSTKNDKVKVITRHWLHQMNPEGTDLLQTRLREGDKAENEPLLDSVTTMAMKTMVKAKAAVMRRMKMITLVVYHLPKNSGNFGWDVNGKTVLVCTNGNFPK